MYELFIANKNYSSWSLRPWVLLSELNIPFSEHLLPFGSEEWGDFDYLLPAGKVPVLKDGDTAIWESLAIAEYLADRHEGVWPADPKARTWARSAAAEMHAGFTGLRNSCSMSCGVRIELAEIDPKLGGDLKRLNALWKQGLSSFGGPFLAGPRFTAADAFFAPIAFRVQTYGLKLDPACQSYVDLLLQLPSMRAWYDAAIHEPWKPADHENHVKASGKLLQDLRG